MEISLKVTLYVTKGGSLFLFLCALRLSLLCFMFVLCLSCVIVFVLYSVVFCFIFDFIN